MESLYTKYRPQTFEQVVGQEHVVETLKRAVVEGKTSHAYLFCGPRGTGKTTMARLLAKALMCDCGPGALPDGTCEQCRLIAAGEHPDVIELDAASRTGVDNVREEIISRVNYAPTRGRCKVYIIDEVHMLTTQAFNALLKTLEEPPAGVVFIMCTTDPQKVLPTILSRVQRFDFHAIGNEAMQAHLADVCRAEGFAYEDAALELVVRHARGGMRDALTSLEQLSVFGAGSITLAAANDFLGEVSGSVLGQVAVALATRDVPALFAQVAELADSGRDFLQFTRELAAHLRDVYVVAAVPGADDVVAAKGAELEALRSEAAAFGSADRVARALTVLGDASSEMRTATNQRLVLEIAYTRLARPEGELTLDALADRVAVLEQRLAAGVVISSGAAEPSAAPVISSGAPEPPAAPVISSGAPESPAAPVISSGAAEGGGVEKHATKRAEGAQQTPPASNGNLQRLWKQVVDDLVAKAPSKGSLLLSSTAVADDGEKLTVSLPKGSHFAAKMLERADVRSVVEEAIKAAFGARGVVYVESSLAATAISQASKPAPTPAPAPAPVPAAPVISSGAAEGGGVEKYDIKRAEGAQQTSVAAPKPAALVTQQTAPVSPGPAKAPAKKADDATFKRIVAELTDAFNGEAASAPEPPASPVISSGAPEPPASPVISSEGREAPEVEKHGTERAEGAQQTSLAPDLAGAASLLSDIFGGAVSMSMESATEPATSDEDAALDLAADPGQAIDPDQVPDDAYGEFIDDPDEYGYDESDD